MSYTTEFDILNAAAAAGANTDKINVSTTPASGAVQSVQNTNTYVTGNLTFGSGDLDIDCTGLGNVTVSIGGTWTGVVGFQASVDGIDFSSVPGNSCDIQGLANQVPLQTSLVGVFSFPVSGYKKLRMHNNLLTGTATIAMGGGVAPQVLQAIFATVYASQSGAWSMTPTGLVLAQASTTAAQTGPLVQAACTTAAPTYITAKTNPLSQNTSGELRAVLSTNSSLAANQSTNVAQINGVAPLMGAGNTGTGSPRITISTDQAILTNAWKCNTAQINGVAPLMGNGVTGTGSQRVTLASDNTINTNTFATRADTFTTATNGTTVDNSTKPMSKFSIQVVATGAVTSWNVVLEGSNNNSNFSNIATVDSVADGSGTLKFGAASTPCLYFRSRCTAISLGAGTNVIATILSLT